MNKAIKFSKLMLVLIASIAITSCVQDDDYTIPTSLGDDENYDLQDLIDNYNEVPFSYAKALYNSDPNNDDENDDAIPFQVTDSIYIKGYISSSDKAGNFYKELYIQNSAENPTSAMKVILDQVDNYNQFNKGREVYIKLLDLHIGEERTGSGIYTIGTDPEFDQYGGTVTSLNFNQIATNILRSNVSEEIVPLNLTFSEVTDDHVGMFVEVNNVEFADNLAGLRYFDPVEVYDTSRTLQTCSGFGYETFLLETSSFADYKTDLLPEGNGTIKAVVSKTYDATSYILALNTVDDVNMENDRCSALDPSDFTNIFSEDFETATNNTDLDFTGWTNFAEAGSWRWREKTYQDNSYTEFSTFGSGNDSNIAWLVTPGFDMDAQANEFLNFKAAQHHVDSDANTLEVFVSSDFDGTDVLGATWIPLSANLPSQNNSWYEFVDSGLIDLSSYTGTIHIAFKVVGSGNNEALDGAYQIDDISIMAN
ncbi:MULTISPECIES: DUF5689 domain-containing protein [Winogradskyella]|uniref:DUF5689 domain-containing protein n=1 Tax=Winogradskyella TaxID=286104 RepID=UPI0015CBF354|nr:MULTISPECIES: DUF5689 domain-containing protein [Winogradskyella]QXP80435.1 hypothetical protein H0I32_07395 [Winogradskyella sp. HaHa_3_26]